MAKKAVLTFKIVPLQRVVAVPITDPAERAALDKIRQRRKRKQGGRNRSVARGAARKT